MKNKEISVLVYIKKKYVYSKREEELATLADALKGRFIGGGTDLVTRKRDQQYFFKDMNSAKTFLDYPTVRETILSEVSVEEVD
jgi:hypothetical protein